MNSLCLVILLASISANVGDTNVQVVDVTCEHYYGNRETCWIEHLDFQSKAPSILNILNADTSNDTTCLKMRGHYTVLPMNLFQLFPKLKILEISTRLEAITKENLVGGNKLKELDLSFNKITEIKAHTFDGMDRFEIIILEGNKLTKVESDAFAGAISLKRLNLGHNEIDTIKDGAFNIPTLEVIDLSYNEFQTLADDVFVGCPHLIAVHLDGNRLTRIGKWIDNLPKLSWLSFGNNNVRMTDFDFYAIARKPDLEYFIAESVALALDEPASAADDHYTAVRLDISGNNLSYPDILHRLRNFGNITHLDLGNNKFTTINDIENIWQMFPNLQELDVINLPCKGEVFQRLQTKFGAKISSFDNRHVYFY